MDSNERLKSGDFVKHFKRELNGIEADSNSFIYVIVDVNGKDCESLKRLVVYRALYDDNQLWVRDYADFMSQVDKNKYPSIKQQYKFEKLSREEENILIQNQLEKRYI